jgi:hypothetical protein
VPTYLAAASLALWREDARAQSAPLSGRGTRRGNEDWVMVARVAATWTEAAATASGESGQRRRSTTRVTLRRRGASVLGEAAVVGNAGVNGSLGRGEADALLATARAFVARLEDEDQAATWAAVAAQWRSRRPVPGRPRTLARRRPCSRATMVVRRVERATRARPPPTSRSAGALPLRALHAVAARAMILSTSRPCPRQKKRARPRPSQRPYAGRRRGGRFGRDAYANGARRATSAAAARASRSCRSPSRRRPPSRTPSG